MISKGMTRVKLPANIETWVARLTAVTSNYLVLASGLEEALLQVFRQVVRHHQLSLDQTLGTGVSPCRSQPVLRLLAAHSTSIAMAMVIPLHLLKGVDHVRHRLDVVGFVSWDLLDSLGIPANIIPL